MTDDYRLEKGFWSAGSSNDSHDSIHKSMMTSKNNFHNELFPKTVTDLDKGAPAKVGERRDWGGVPHIKQQDGKWIPVKQSQEGTATKPSESPQPQPQPAGGGGAQKKKGDWLLDLKSPKEPDSGKGKTNKPSLSGLVG